MSFKGTVLLFLLLMVVVFTAQNYETVRVSFLFWSFRTSQAILIFSALFIGVVAGWLTAKRRKEGPRLPENR